MIYGFIHHRDSLAHRAPLPGLAVDQQPIAGSRSGRYLRCLFGRATISTTRVTATCPFEWTAAPEKATAMIPQLARVRKFYIRQRRTFLSEQMGHQKAIAIIENNAPAAYALDARDAFQVPFTTPFRSGRGGRVVFAAKVSERKTSACPALHVDDQTCVSAPCCGHFLSLCFRPCLARGRRRCPQSPQPPRPFAQG
jgi:hypothetical protein